MLHSKLGTQVKLGKAAGIRIAGAAVFNSGTLLAGLGYGGTRLGAAVGASTDTDTSIISIVILVVLGLLSGLVMLLGLIGMCQKGTDQLREEEQWLEMTSKRGASKVAHPMKLESLDKAIDEEAGTLELWK